MKNNFENFSGNSLENDKKRQSFIDKHGAKIIGAIGLGFLLGGGYNSIKSAIEDNSVRPEPKISEVDQGYIDSKENLKEALRKAVEEKDN